MKVAAIMIIAFILIVFFLPIFLFGLRIWQTGALHDAIVFPDGGPYYRVACASVDPNRA